MLGLATGDGSVGAFEALLAEELDVEVDQILSWDLGLMDLQPSTLGGLDDAFVFAPRLDNQASCHAGISALLKAGPAKATRLLRFTITKRLVLAQRAVRLAPSLKTS